MHKRIVNQCTIRLSLSPKGPIMIKSGKEGADPTKPDMEFVETYHAGGYTIYLPGSSLKGALRAHTERIVRTVGSDRWPGNADAEGAQPLWASNPLEKESYKYLEKETDPQKIYRLSSFTDQLFGSVMIASRFRVEDAYPMDADKVKTEERNGVAIDRVFGSVAVGPFNYQVCTAGTFETKIHLKNFSLEQLGLIGLVLRDLAEGWFGIGFAKSRGMGLVSVDLLGATISYPSCLLKDGNISALIGSAKQWEPNQLAGAGEFLEAAERQKYGFPADDVVTTEAVAQEMAYGVGVQMIWEADEVEQLFRLAARKWRDCMIAEVSV
ncbi:MAG: RAMP superfamily CRISPR-associated protein [Cyanobacteria bacterium J06623_5]